MSADIPSRSMTDVGRSERRPWAAGLTVFAAAVMMISGVWHAFAGIGALVNDKVYVTTPRYIYSFDLTAWGWTLIVLGVAVAAAGFAVLLGETWARVAGIVLASLSLIANFLFLPHYPVWSIVIMALDIAAIWALATYRSELVWENPAALRSGRGLVRSRPADGQVCAVVRRGVPASLPAPASPPPDERFGGIAVRGPPHGPWIRGERRLRTVQERRLITVGAALLRTG